mgnify:FL=1
MHFCSNCGNMYYIQLDGDTNLMYYCRKCGFQDKNISKDIANLCVSKTHLSKNTKMYSQVINKYTKLDPTLPRIKNMLCVNNDCPSNSETPNENHEIIYIRYDDTNMKYVYLCCSCDNTWKT